MTRKMTKISAWSFLFALFLAGLVTFPAWLVLPLVGVDPLARLTAAALAFAVFSAGFLVYAHCCLRRNLSDVRSHVAR
jgi:hypothetical protein